MKFYGNNFPFVKYKIPIEKIDVFLKLNLTDNISGKTL